MSDHTPGPWVVKGSKVWEEKHFYKARRGIVAEPSISWRDSAEFEANARLIAAAPDLLAALKEWDRLSLVIDSAVRRADPTYADDVLGRIRAGRAAIAKARGEE